MLATAPTPRTSASTTAICPPVIRTELVLPRTVTVEGRVCSTPTLSFTSTGVAVAHFLLDCAQLDDPRLQRLARPGTCEIDVTVWRADAVFVAHPAAALSFRYRLVVKARGALPEHRKADATAWDITAPFTPPIRSGVRVTVEGTPRRGAWYPIGHGKPVPLGLVAEGLPRPIRAAALCDAPPAARLTRLR